MEENNKDNITIGLPKPSGAIYWAPQGTALPTDATTPLSENYTNLGFVTADGVTLSDAEETEEIQAWGPETVMTSQSSYGVNATFNLLETSRIAVLQFIYGKDNVTVNEDGSVSWRTTGEQLPRGVLVIDTLQNNGSTKARVHRHILGDCQFVDRSGDRTYNNSDAVSYPVNMKAYKFKDPSSESTMVYELNYLAPKATTTEPEPEPSTTPETPAE